MAKQKKATPKSTDVKFSTIKQIAKQNNEMEKYEFEDGTTLSFYPTFPPQLLEKMFEEIQHAMTTKPEDLEFGDNMTHKYVLFMVIKHFTHLKNQLKATTLIGQINEMESIVDSGYFEKIVEEVFLPIEIQKVFDQLAKFGSSYLFLEKMTEKMQDGVSKLELQNANLFKQIGNGTNAENNIVQ